MKRLLFLLGLLSVALVMPVKAEASVENQIVVAGNMCFDPDTQMFVFNLSDIGAESVSCSVPDGMLTNGPVFMDYSVATNIQIFKDGVKLEGKYFEKFSEPGAYVVNALSNGVTHRVLGFTITDGFISLKSYQVPNGFVVSGMTLDGEEIDCDSDVAYFDAEGEYVITFACGKTHSLFDLFVTVDQTPPTLELEGVVNGVAKSAVSLKDAEPDSTLFIEYNNDVIPATDVLTDTGTYHVRITDKAGNSNDYYFDITVGLNSNSLLFIIIFALLVIGVAVYLIMSRRKMRIR